jgi:16S rRNA (uracil1498-N3)-methyltransferase
MISWRIINAIPSGLQTSSRQELDSVFGILRLLPVVNNPLNWARARRNAAPEKQYSRNFSSFGLKRRELDHLDPVALPSHDFRKPRLFVDAPLRSGATVALARDQSNYLGNVLRLSAGDSILVFNGRDGEWQASITGRKRPDGLEIATRTRSQDRLPNLAYVFAPLKHARLDYMVQKAVEMGVSSLQPVLTRFTQVSRVNSERMRANVIEAAEQCGILGIADVAEPVAFDRFLDRRTSERLLVFCDEAADVTKPLGALQGGKAVAGIDVLIGPEGGFAEEERAMLLRQPNTIRLSLGPRILRADTAGIAALALVQAALGDWTEGPGR